MILAVRIIPNASKNEIIGWSGDQLKIRIAAPPDRGKANKELVRFLSKNFNLPRNTIQILKGEKSRDKLLEIEGVKILSMET